MTALILSKVKTSVLEKIHAHNNTSIVQQWRLQAPVSAEVRINVEAHHLHRLRGSGRLRHDCWPAIQLICGRPASARSARQMETPAKKLRQDCLCAPAMWGRRVGGPGGGAATHESTAACFT